MNQGKRYILYTTCALGGLTLLLATASWVSASVDEANTPRWQRTLLSLGLQMQDNRKRETPTQPITLADAGQLRFTRIDVDGDFAVEAVTAPVHKVSLVSGKPTSILAAQGEQGDLLKLTGGPDSAGAVLRIEAPALAHIEAANLRQLTVRGSQAPEFTIRTKKVAALRIEESAVGRWILKAETPVEVLADKATMSAGLNIDASGNIDFQSHDGKVKLRGNGGKIMIKSAGLTTRTDGGRTR